MLQVDPKSSYQDKKKVKSLWNEILFKPMNKRTNFMNPRKAMKKIIQNEVLALGQKQKGYLWKNKSWAVLKFLLCITECQRTTQNFNGKNLWTEYSMSTNLLFYYESNRRHSYVKRTWKISQPSPLLEKKEKNKRNRWYNSSDKNTNTNKNTGDEPWHYLKTLDLHNWIQNQIASTKM